MKKQEKIKELAKQLGFEVDDEMLKRHQDNKNLMKVLLSNLELCVEMQNDIIAMKQEIFAILQACLKLSLHKKTRNERIKELAQAGITQEKLAEIFKISQSAISQILNKY